MRDEVTVKCAVMRLRERLDRMKSEGLERCALWRIYEQRLIALRWVLGDDRDIILPKEVEELFWGLV